MRQFLLTTVALTLTATGCAPEPTTSTILIRNAIVVDGTGAVGVCVNGTLVFDNGALTGERPGSVIRWAAAP